jgi:site-specific DNA recombinase
MVVQLRSPLAAGIYVRISSDPELKRLGVQRQEQDCREYVKRQGWKLAKVYEDNDVSAYNGKIRPAYRQLLEDVRAGAIQAIVTWHPDRMHRNLTDLEEFIQVVQTAGCRVETIKAGNLDLSTPAGQMVAGHLGVAARYESAHKAERVRRKHQELAAAGKSAGGGRPFGYEADRRRVRPAEAELVREAARRVLDGEAMRAICRDWNERGIPTVKGAPDWVPQVLRRLLVSARISGRREYSYAEGRRLDIGRITSKTAEWLPIISAEDSDHLRHLLGGHRRQGQVREYLLTGGIARCGRCKQPLQAHPRSLTQKEIAAGMTEGRKEMACVRRGKNDPHCGRLGILAKPVEELVAKAIFRAVDAGALARALKPGDNRAALKELLEVQTKQNELTDMWSAGELSADQWRRASARLKEREATAKRQIESQRRPRGLDGVPDVLATAWPSLPIHRRRAIVEVLIEAVDIAPATAQSQRNALTSGMLIDPSRVRVRWKA